ncbi:hypothetical protein DMN91_006439 [Ooceraea biroi]|uniref:Odorant receptor n=1 Tax=Ooceraea biroi TaxID=2015173 RepID=A0A026WG71_OOCBI|nr:uncharacterized protein LOC105279573 isoform X2 [Ooceraea biroi]EZA54938.1 hypothetical protein X777_05462 [Ooceraea biroi]RLU22059.1 hypothetical protein DMN91_006439 [Ooceraea biroi]
MEHPEERYYKLNRFFLSVNGLSPYQNVWNARLIRLVITVILLSSIFVQASTTLTSEVNLEFIIDIIPAILPTFAGIINLYLHHGNIDKYRKLFDHMWRDWALQKTKDEIKIMHDYAETTRLVTLFYTLQVCILFVMYNVWVFMPEILDVISPLNESRPRIETFKVEFFIDKGRYIYLIQSHICLVLVTVTIVLLGSFSILLTFTQHVCGMCKLLGYRAERLFCVIENAAGCDLIRGTKIRCRDTAVFVRLHCNIIQFISLIKACHRVSFLCDLIGILFALSLTLIQILSIAGNIEKAIKSISFSIIILIYSFISNYMGQRITDMSSNICEKVYNCAWYNVAVSEQKSVLLIISRRFHPLVLTANKFYTMSLQNFGMILQTVISYCMFFRQI